MVSKPAIDKVIVRIVPEAAVEKALMLEGDADVHYWPGENAAREYEQSDNVNLLLAPTERWVMRLIPNMAEYGSTDPEANPHPFLSDVRVRRAIRMAVDVDTILAEIFQGYGHPVHTEFFRDPYICDVPAPEYDMDGAAALLDEAGWTDNDGDGIRECNGCETAEDGTPMSMEFAIYAEYGEELELAQQYIAESLQELGFDVQLQIIEGTVMWSPAEDGGTEANGNFDLAITGHDWINDHLAVFPSSPVRELLDLKSSRVRIVAVVSNEVPADDIFSLRQMIARQDTPFRVASEYVNIADKYARDNHLGMYKVVPTWGATEAFLPEDADMLIENTETGRTIARHNLKIIDTLFRSTGCLIGGKNAKHSPVKQERIRLIVEKLRVAVEKD